MVSIEGQHYYQELLKGTSFGRDSFDFIGLRLGMATPQPPNDAEISVLPVQIGEIPGHWVLAPGVDPGFRLLYLHGGGFISGNGAFYLTLAARISSAAGCAVLLPDYRLGPEFPFPAALEDCSHAYDWMLANGPDAPTPARAAFIAGDSAGGGLTLSTLLARRDRGLSLPRGAVTLSAFTDLTLQAGSIRLEGDKDPIMHPNCLPEFVKRYLGDTDPHNPLASPVFGDYRGLPPLLIQVGEHEIIRDDSCQTAEQAQAAGVDATLEVWEGMFHVFPSHEPLLPEARQAIDHIAAFLQKHAA